MPENPTPTQREAGRRLRANRSLAGLKQGDIATALEVHRQQVGRWERGQSDVPAHHRRALAQLLHVPEPDIWSDPGAANVSRGASPVRAVREVSPLYNAHPPTDTPSAALYWAVAEMNETLARISREAARLASKRP